ncbi:MAG: hypothetical protein ACJ76N_13060 [Thermoanaerobaculia bacterium]
MNDKKPPWLESISLIAAGIAVAISVYALKVQRELEHETSTQTLIHAQYELCRALDQMRVEHPELSHMLALPAQSGKETWTNYYEFKKRVRGIFEDKDGKSALEQNNLYLKEHAVALNVFDIYEQTLWQRQLAEKASDQGRFRVLDMLANYYEKRMLRNPRLRYHWDHGGSDMLEKETRNRYDKKVRQAFPSDPIDNKSPIQD